MAQRATGSAVSSQEDLDGFRPNNAAKDWDVEAKVREGVVTVRELSQHTPEVLRCVEDLNRTVVVTRYGKIIAAIAPVTMRKVVDQLIANNGALRDGLSAAEDSLQAKETRSVEYLLKEMGAE